VYKATVLILNFRAVKQDGQPVSQCFRYTKGDTAENRHNGLDFNKNCQCFVLVNLSSFEMWTTARGEIRAIYRVAQKSKLLYCVNSLLFLSHPV